MDEKFVWCSAVYFVSGKEIPWVSGVAGRG